MSDISSFMSSFISSFLSILYVVYESLSNIQFMGISLLSYIISLFVLSAAIPIIISIIRGGYSSSRGYFRRSRSSSARSGGSDNE